MAYFPEAFPATLDTEVLLDAPSVTPTSTTAGQCTLAWGAVDTPANADPAYAYRAQVAQNVTIDPRFDLGTGTNWDTFWSGTITTAWSGSALLTSNAAGAQNSVLRSRGCPNDGAACTEGDIIVVQGKVRTTATGFQPHISLLTNTTGIGTAQFFATGVQQQTINLTSSASYVPFTVTFVVPAGGDVYNVFFRANFANVGEFAEWDDIFIWKLNSFGWTTTTNTSVTISGLTAGQDYTAFVQARNLAGWGALSAPETVYQGGATFQGGGTFTTSAVRSVPASAAFAGGGTFTASAVREVPATASFNGGGTLTASGTVVPGISASFTGGGTLTATATRAVPATATFAGGGTLTASATREQPATATFAGGGTLTASAVRTQPATATFQGGGTLAAVPTLGQAATATFSGGGTLLASYSGGTPATATFNGAGTLTAAAVRVVSATATFSGAGTLTATAVRAVTATATFAGGGTLAVTAVLVRPATATFQGGHTLSAAAAIVFAATATFSGGGTLIALAIVTEGILRIAVVSLPAAYDQYPYVVGKGRGRLWAHIPASPTQRVLLLNRPSAAHPSGTVRVSKTAGFGAGWDADDVIYDPANYRVGSSQWQADVLKANGYEMEAVL